MFTVEFEYDASVITSLDETDTCEDIQLVLGNDGIVFLRQFEEGLDEHQLITITYAQLLDLFVALQSTEGAYYVKRETNSNT
jgi:hypothetical protein